MAQSCIRGGLTLCLRPLLPASALLSWGQSWCSSRWLQLWWLFHIIGQRCFSKHPLGWTREEDGEGIALPLLIKLLS